MIQPFVVDAVFDNIISHLSNMTYKQFDKIMTRVTHSTTYLIKQNDTKNDNKNDNKPKNSSSAIMSELKKKFDKTMAMMDEKRSISDVGYNVFEKIGERKRENISIDKYFIADVILNNNVYKEYDLWDTMSQSELNKMCIIYIGELDIYRSKQNSFYSQGTSASCNEANKINLKLLRLNDYIKRRKSKQIKFVQQLKNLKNEELHKSDKLHSMHFEFLIEKSNTMDKYSDDILSYYRNFINSQCTLEDTNVTCRVSSFDDNVHLIYEGPLSTSLLTFDRDKFNLKGQGKKLYKSIGNTINKLHTEMEQTSTKFVWFIIITDNKSSRFDDKRSFYVRNKLSLLNDHWFFTIIGTFNHNHKKISSFINHICELEQLSISMKKLSTIIINQRKIIYEKDKR